MEELEQFFFFLNLELIINFINNFLIIEVTKKMFFLLFALFVIFLLTIKDNNESLSFILLDNNIPPIKKSAKICCTPNSYFVVTHYKVFLSVAQSEIQELLNYYKVVYFLNIYF